MMNPPHFTTADKALADKFATVLADETAHPIIATINDTTWDAPVGTAAPIQFDAEQRYELAALLAVIARRHAFEHGLAHWTTRPGTDSLPPT